MFESFFLFPIEFAPRRDLGSCSWVSRVRGRRSQGSGGEGGGQGEASHPAQAPEQGRDHREDVIPGAFLFVLHGQETRSDWRLSRVSKYNTMILKYRVWIFIKIPSIHALTKMWTPTIFGNMILSTSIISVFWLPAYPEAFKNITQKWKLPQTSLFFVCLILLQDIASASQLLRSL